jgi:hypothetical protein
MTSTEVLIKTVENFTDYIDYCLNKPFCEIRMGDWMTKLNNALDDVYREQQGLPPRPIPGRPKGSKDKGIRVKRKH